MKLIQKILASCIAAGTLVSPAFAADSKKEARVTQIIRDVKLLPADAAARAAIVNDKVSENTGVRTGGESRSELTFEPPGAGPDQSAQTRGYTQQARAQEN